METKGKAIDVSRRQFVDKLCRGGWLVQLTTDGACPRVEEYAAQNYCISDYGVR